MDMLALFSILGGARIPSFSLESDVDCSFADAGCSFSLYSFYEFLLFLV